ELTFVGMGAHGAKTLTGCASLRNVTSPRLGYNLLADARAPEHAARLHPRPPASLALTRPARHRLSRRAALSPPASTPRRAADALRWTAIAGLSLGSDLILDPNDLETTFAPGRNFANKLWNIGRFILAQLPERVEPLERFEQSKLPLADRWILTRANDAVAAV